MNQYPIKMFGTINVLIGSLTDKYVWICNSFFKAPVTLSQFGAKIAYYKLKLAAICSYFYNSQSPNVAMVLSILKTIVATVQFSSIELVHVVI